MNTSADPAAALSAELDALLERRAAECPEPWKATLEVAIADYHRIKAMRAEIVMVRVAAGYVVPAPALHVYPVSHREDGPGYMVDVIGGPGSIVWMVTEKAAIECALAYIDAHYWRTAKGRWFAASI